MFHDRRRLALTALLAMGIGLLAPAQAGAYDDFFKAVVRDDVPTVHALLQRGFDPNTLSPDRQSGLHLALRESALKVASLLLQAPKIDLDILNAADESPLMLAALKGHGHLARQLIDKGADINKTGWTALHYAATSAQVPLIALLLEKSAYIDAESPNGTTPLMMAAMYGTTGAVKLLLEEGADPLLKNEQGLSAIDFAQRANKGESVEVIAAFVRARQPKGKW